MMMILTGAIVGYSYAVETFMSWYGADKFERQFSVYRAFGVYGPLFWAMLLFNVVVPMTFFFKKL